MNTLLNSIALFIKDRNYLEKVIIVENHAVGNQISEALVKDGVNHLNLSFKTITQIAEEISVEQLGKVSVRHIDSEESRLIIDLIYNQLSTAKDIKYFVSSGLDSGIVNSLAGSIINLRVNGIYSHNLKKDAILDESKYNDLVKITAKYEDYLKANNLIDDVGIINEAIKSGSKVNVASKLSYAIPANICISPLEKQFLVSAVIDPVILTTDIVHGLANPKNVFARQDGKKSLINLGYLYEQDKVDGDTGITKKDIGIFNTVGYEKELFHCFRDIHRNKHKYDEVEIVYTDLNIYKNLVVCACMQNNIPATFSEGIPPYYVRSGRFILGILEWIRSDFQDRHLISLLQDSLINYKYSDKETESSGPKLGAILRDAVVGWGRERYEIAINAKLREYEELKNDKDGEDTGRTEYYENRINWAKELTELCKSLFALIPTATNVNFAEYCKNIRLLFDQYLPIQKSAGESIEKEFRGKFKLKLESIEKISNYDIAAVGAIEKLFAIVSEISVGAKSPEPGKLHIYAFTSTKYSFRKNLYIIGLDESKFPLRTVQDAVLLDDEKKNILPDLLTSQEAVSNHIYQMAYLMVSASGNIKAGMSAFDFKENRTNYPSSVLLQIYRLLKDKDAVYEDLTKYLELIKEGYGDSNNQYLDQDEFWMEKVTRKTTSGKTLKDALPSILTIDSGLGRGEVALREAGTSNFTEYDGKVLPLGNELDLRKENITVSASMIELAATCPYRYFLKYVLKIKQRAREDADRLIWLNALERGSLIHKVYEIFVSHHYKESFGSISGQEKEIHDVLLQQIEEYRKKIPFQNEALMKLEIKLLEEDIKVFIRINDEIMNNTDFKAVPFKCELEFGDKKEDAVEISLADGKKLLLRGKIDRLDLCEDNESVIVWDYKTGRPRGFGKRMAVSGCRKIQHCLYSAAAPKILEKEDKKNYKVKSAGYLFATKKGILHENGPIHYIKNDDASVWKKPLNILLDLIAKGKFNKNADDKDVYCSNCEYLYICGKNKKEMGELAAEKKSDKYLSEWSELQTYE